MNPRKKTGLLNMGSLFHVSHGIRRRILLWFLLASSLPLLFSVLFSLRTGFSSMQDSLGGYFSAVARQAAGRLDAVLTGEIHWLNHVVLDNQIMDFLTEANGHYNKLDPAAIDALFRADNGPSPASIEPLHTPANRISQRLKMLADSRKGMQPRITITDRHGVVIASSHTEAALHHRESEWFKRFQSVDPPGLYVGVRNAPDSAFLMVEPIFLGLRMVGAVELAFEPSMFSEMVSQLQLGDSGWGLLVDSEGRTLFCYHTEKKPDEEDVHPRFHLSAKPASGWMFHPNHVDTFWRGIVGFAQVREVTHNRARFGLTSWHVLISQDPAETYATAREALVRAGIVGTLAILFLGVAGLMVAHHIATPLLGLQQAVAQFAEGRRCFHFQVDSRDEIQGLAEAFQNMAEQVEAFEDRLRAFSDAVSHSMDAIILTDTENRIYFANPAFEHLTGYSRDDVFGRDPGLLASGKMSGDVYDKMWQCLKCGEPWRGEMINRRKDGSHFVADMTISPILDPEKRLLGYIGAQRDVTLARQTQEIIRQDKEPLAKFL